MDQIPRHVVVVFDEAYYEYMPEGERPDALRCVREGRPVLVLRSFSKIYGLAGLRIGYAMAPPELIQILDRARQPYNVNALAQAAASAALNDTTHLSKSRRLNETGKRYLHKQFEALGLAFVRTAANFILVDVGTDGGEVTENLKRQGVLVHPMGRFGLKTHIRVTTGTREENQRFIRALQEILKPSRVLRNRPVSRREMSSSIPLPRTSPASPLPKSSIS